MTKDEAREAAWKDLRINEWRLRIRGTTLQRQAGEACDAMFDAGYEFATRWNVIDRDGLPTDQDGYLVTRNIDDDDHMMTLVVEERWFSFTNGFSTNGVIAWRPLPEPYKGE